MKRFVSILLVCLLLCTAMPLSVFAADDPMKVVLSVEGFSLGEGYFVEPTEYTVSQINDLVKKDGYGPFTEDTLTAGMATLAMFNDKSLTVTINYGTWESGGYLDKIADIDNGNVHFPAVVTANGGPSNDNYNKNADKDLGAADYEPWSGWMSTVNDEFPAVSLCDLVLKTASLTNRYGNTYVIRWQFALSRPAQGEDAGFDMNRGLGYPGWDGSDPYFRHANKDQAMIAYAESSNTRAKAKAKPVLEKLDATQSEVDGTIESLGKAPTVWDRILDFFDRIVAFFKNLFKRG